MKQKTNLLWLAMLILIAGCAATQEFKTSVTSKVSSVTSSVDPTLVSKLQADKKGKFLESEFNLNVADQKLKLAELKNELASSRKKYADLEEDFADEFQREASIDYDLVKIEAIIASNLGNMESNLKTRTKLQVKKLEAQTARVKINANMETEKRKIDSLAEEVDKMAEAIADMKLGN